MDDRGHRLAAREIREQWDPMTLQAKAEEHAQRMWHLFGCPPGWDVTLDRPAPTEYRFASRRAS